MARKIKRYEALVTKKGLKFPQSALQNKIIIVRAKSFKEAIKKTNNRFQVLDLKLKKENKDFA